MDQDMKWFTMPVEVQISNIGSEVSRAIRCKNRGERDKAANFCKKAISFWESVMRDPKNAKRTGEFQAAIDELKDCFLGNNEYHTTDEMLIRYYDAWIASGRV